MANRPKGQVDPQGRPIPDSFGDLEFRGAYTGTNLTHRGFAKLGAAEGELKWQLALLEYDGSNNLLSIKWPQNAFGKPSAEYEFSWTDRATYTYS